MNLTRPGEQSAVGFVGVENSKERKMSTAAEKKRGEFERVGGKGYPAPKELATPTDLKPQEVQRIVEAVNPLIADAFALYTKTKNFHWHLAGSHFRDYHLLLDEQAGGIFESIDPPPHPLPPFTPPTIHL